MTFKKGFDCAQPDKKSTAFYSILKDELIQNVFCNLTCVSDGSGILYFLDKENKDIAYSTTLGAHPKKKRAITDEFFTFRM